jgi:hypothetical protein
VAVVLVVASGLAAALALNVGGASPRASAHAHPPAPKCFGAASRDPRRPCSNPSLADKVVPTPAQAPTLPNAPCTAIVQDQGLQVCEFGVPAARASATFALVGDSHAGGWRAAAQAVARAKDWHGFSITHTSCPLSTAVRNLADPERFALCAQWKTQVFQWFAAHPEVSTVFVAGLSGGRGVVPTPGMSEFETSVAGYIGAWNALPATVKHIVVIHDTPKVLAGTAACVERAMARRERAGVVCAVPRGRALDPDPLVAAAHRLHSTRVQVVDLRRLFCDRRLCYPVIGGALVFRDVTHMTATFAATLGPYLLHDVDRLITAWQ